jgi:hypothetical protein
LKGKFLQNRNHDCSHYHGLRLGRKSASCPQCKALYEHNRDNGSTGDGKCKICGCQIKNSEVYCSDCLKIEISFLAMGEEGLRYFYNIIKKRFKKLGVLNEKAGSGNC